MMRIALVSALVLGSAAIARAGDASGPSERSMGVAMGLSAGGTVAGLGLAGLALADDGMSIDLRRWTMSFGLTAALVMPTAGHWYANGHFGGATTGAYLRLAGGSVTVFTGVVYAVSEHEEDAPGDHSADIELGIMCGGLALIAAGVIVDIATTPAAVHRANGRAGGLHVTAIAPTPGGFALAGTF